MAQLTDLNHVDRGRVVDKGWLGGLLPVEHRVWDYDPPRLQGVWSILGERGCFESKYEVEGELDGYAHTRMGQFKPLAGPVHTFGWGLRPGMRMLLGSDSARDPQMYRSPSSRFLKGGRPL